MDNLSQGSVALTDDDMVKSKCTAALPFMCAVLHGLSIARKQVLLQFEEWPTCF